MRRWLLGFILLLLPTVLCAQNTPINRVPSTTGSGAATYNQDMDLFLRQEAADRQGEQPIFPTGVVALGGGGLHGTAASMTSPPFATLAYTSAGNRLVQASASINYATQTCPTNGTAWVIASPATTTTLATFLHVPGTHYFTDCTSGPSAQPPLPADSVSLMKVTLSGGQITAVTDLAPRTIPGLAQPGLRWAVVPADCVNDPNGGKLTVTATNQVVCAPDQGGGGGGGSGDVTSVGNCLTGACLNGTATGGTTMALYDGNSNKGTVQTADLTADRTYTLPDADGTLPVRAGIPVANQVAVWQTVDALTGLPSLIYTAGILRIGTTGTTGGLALAGQTAGVVTVRPPDSFTSYNFTVPTTPGAAGQVLTSQGGGGTPMVWTTPTADIPDGPKGTDITVSGSGTIWTILPQAVTYAKIQNIAASQRLLGRTTAGAGSIEELTPAQVKTMLGITFGDLTGTATDAQIPNLNTLSTGLLASRCVETDGSGNLSVAAGACGVSGSGTGITGGVTNAPLYATGATTATSTAALTNGQVLLGSTGSPPVPAVPQGATNQITVTPGAGTLTFGIATNPTLPGTTTGSFAGPLAGNATTASALATNPANCTGSNFAKGIDATGVCEGAQVNFTDLAGTASDVQIPHLNTLSSGLTPSRCVETDSSGNLSVTAGVCALGISGATANAPVYATGPTSGTSTAALTSGQMLIGSTGAAPVPATIGGTINQITVSPGPGTLSLAIANNPTLPGTTSGSFAGPLAGNATTATGLSAVLACAQHPALTGDVTTPSGSCATTIPTGSIAYTKLQNVSPSVLLGRGSAGSGPPQEMTLGGGLSIAGTTVSVSAGAVPASQYGVVCDGTTDTTAALQTVLNLRQAAPRATTGFAIVMPRGGQCKLTTTVTIDSVNDLALQGNDVEFIWAGAAGIPMFVCRDCNLTRFENFRVRVSTSAPVSNVLQFENGAGSSVTPTRNTVQFVTIECTNGGCTNGVVMAQGAGGDANDEFNFFSHMNVNNYTGSAFRIEHAQSKHNFLSHVGGSGNGLGQHFLRVDPRGSFVCEHCTGGGHLAADFHVVNATDFATIRDSNFEGSAALLDTGGPSTTPYPVNIENVRWDNTNLRANNRVIVYQYRGPLRLSGLFVEQGPTPKPTEIYINPLGAIGSFVAEGNAIATTLADPFTNIRPTSQTSNIRYDGSAWIALQDRTQAIPPAAQALSAGTVITADACGGTKLLSATGAATTNTTNTFDAPAGGNVGCKMDVCNTSAFALTLDANTNFRTIDGNDVVLGAATASAIQCASVTQTGSQWVQVSGVGTTGSGGFVDVSGTPTLDQIALFQDNNTIKGTSTLSMNVTDFNVSTANRTAPNKVGTNAAKPATCAVGDTYFASDAPAGQNIYACTATNTWTLEGGTGGGGVTTDTAQRAAFYNTTTTVDGAPALTFDSTGSTLTSSAPRITTIAATATLGLNDGPVVACTGGAADVTLTLPPGATTTQRKWSIVKVDAGAGRCLVKGNGTETINGSTGTLAATTQRSRVDLDLDQTTGTPNWSGITGKTAIDLATDVGTSILPSANGGTANAFFTVAGPATSAKTFTFPNANATIPQVVASGTAALSTSSITSGGCNTTDTVVSASGVVTTDVISWTPNANISAVTGYAPVTTGALIIYPFPTANNVNFRVCNPTANPITPGAVTLNWRVTR